MKEELIQFIHQAVENKFSADQCPLNGAALAELVRVKFTDGVVQEAGYEKLSHAVRDASDRGLIHRNPNVKHLEVLPLLSKLLRRKYWNKDESGHKWLRETKLLNQSPVTDRDRGIVRVKALEILPRLKTARVLLTKGTDGGGGTPKEWSINTEFLPKIKTVIIEATFDALADVESIADLIFSIIDSSQERDINAFDKIINTKTLEVCQDPHDSDGSGEEDDEDED